MSGYTQTIASERHLSQRSSELVPQPLLKSSSLKIPGLLIIEPKVFTDERGVFLESFNERAFRTLGIREHFVQDNHSVSKKNVIRGLHYQCRHAQGKLVRAVVGEILDVAVDLRRDSPTCGEWCSVRLSATDRTLFWIPQGFAHGFLVLSDYAEVLYKATDYYAPEYERTIVWNDPDLDISWPVSESQAIVSAKDRAGSRFCDSEGFI